MTTFSRTVPEASWVASKGCEFNPQPFCIRACPLTHPVDCPISPDPESYIDHAPQEVGARAFNRDCAEPIVVLGGGFERDALMVEKERGTVAVTVMVVREVAAEAESVAVAAELAVRRADWEPFADAGACRIVGIDTTSPDFKERDSSGRFVWAFDVLCTVVRSL